MSSREAQQLDEFRVHPAPPSDVHGFEFDHPYLEIVYAPLIGPSGVILARALTRRLALADGPVTVNIVDLAREVGLRASAGGPVGRTAAVRRALDRLVRVRLARWYSATDLALERTVRPLSDRALRRVPDATRTAHRSFTTDGAVD